MRLLEIVDRSKDEYSPIRLLGTHVSTPEEVIKLIEGHCSTVLAAYRQAGGVLYRGVSDVRDNDSPVITAKIRQDRRPVHKDRQAHELLHQAFIELGLKATRKNSIFCTAQDALAHDWGEAYIVFPKDGWTATVYSAGLKTYGFYRQLQYVRAAESTFEINQWKKKNPKLTQEPDMTVVGELAKILKREDAPKSISTAEGLAEIIKAGWADVLITGDSYVAVAVPELQIKKNRQFTNAVLEGLKLKW